MAAASFRNGRGGECVVSARGLLLWLLLAAGCARDAAHEDAEYLERVLEGLRPGMSVEEVRTFFRRYHHELRIESQCSGEGAGEAKPCASGYRSTAVIGLPSRDPAYGAGVARVYLRLDSTGALKDYFHDLYYEGLDNPEDDRL